MGKNEIKASLAEIVGPRNVSDSEVVLESYTSIPFSGRAWRTMHDFVVLPETPEQISEIVKLANKEKFKITPRGGFGMGGLPGYQVGVLLDLTLMNRILKIDAENAKTIAEAGCSFHKLVYELFKVGLILPTAEYGPAPTVGASAHNPALGFGKTRYGLNNDLVEGLEVVLPTGEIVKVGSLAYEHTEFGPYTRYTIGPDLVGLFVKHGGTLGIITKVAYRCLRKPEKFGFYTYYWPHAEAEGVAQASRELVKREVFDLLIGDRWRTLPEEETGLIPRLPEDCWFLLFIINTAENDEELKAKEKWVDEICTSFGGKKPNYNVAQSEWDWPTFFQPTAHPMMGKMFERAGYKLLYIPDNLNFPLAKFPEVYYNLEKLGKKYGLYDKTRQFALDGFVIKDLSMMVNIWTWIDPYDKELRKAAGKLHWENEELFGPKGATWMNMYPPLVPDWAWKNQPDIHELFYKIKKLLDPGNVLDNIKF